MPLNAQPCSETFNRRERASCLGMAKEAPLDPALVSEQKGGKEVRIEKGREEPAKPGNWRLLDGNFGGLRDTRRS